MKLQAPVSEAVTHAVEEIVRREMGPFGLVEVSVVPTEDHDGDPILMIDARYDLGGRPIDPKVVAHLVGKLRERLWALDEPRFPHVRHHFLEQQKVVGFP